MADLEIQNAFLDGLDEIFNIMFTDQVKMYLLDPKKTKVNVYGESSDPVFQDPILMTAKVVLSTSYASGSDSSSAFFREKVSATISIPAKQFITKEIPYDTEEALENLRRCEFEYSGFRFVVNTVNLGILIADRWHKCEFQCERKRVSSVSQGRNV